MHYNNYNKLWCFNFSAYLFNFTRIAIHAPRRIKILTLVLRLGVIKAPAQFLNQQKKFCSALGAVLSWLFLNMKWVQNATIRSPIGAPEVVWHEFGVNFLETSEILWSFCRLSFVVAITFFELVVVEDPRVQLETKTFVVLVLKLVGDFLPPSATRVRKNRSAYEG